MAQVTFKLSELDELIKNHESGVTLVPKCVRQLILSPYQLQDLKNSIRTYLYSTVAKYDPQLHGIILSYKRIKIEDFFNIQDDGKSKFRYTADIYVFKPRTDSILSGVINKKGTDHLSCLVHRVFNIAIPRPDNLENDESWIGSKLSIGQEVQFKVVDVDLNEDMPYIKGELIDQPGTCHCDNYTVEDMEIEDDGSNSEEEQKRDKIFDELERGFSKEKCQSVKDLATAVMDDVKRTDVKNETMQSDCDIYSYAQVFIKNCYYDYNELFSSMARRKLFQNLNFYDRSKNKNISRWYRSENLCILVLCDFLNYDFIFSHRNKNIHKLDIEIKEENDCNKGNFVEIIKSERTEKNKKLNRKKEKKKADKEFCKKFSKINLKQKHKSDKKIHEKDLLESKRIKTENVHSDDDDIIIIKEIKRNKAVEDDDDVAIIREIKKGNVDDDVEVTEESKKENVTPEVSAIDMYSSFLDTQMDFKKLVKKRKIFCDVSEEKGKHIHKKKKKKRKRKKRKMMDGMDY